MKKIYALIIPVFLVVSLPSLQGCATEPVSFKIENSLSQNKLAYYNDSFDKLREDLWEKVGLAWSQAQLANLRIADITIEDGELRIETKMGGFSKGGLASKYRLRGDFDVQIDCHIDFLGGIHDMDQLLVFAVLEKGEKSQNWRLIPIALLKKGKSEQREIFSGYREKGRYQPGNWRHIGNFHGTLRIVRAGSKISTLYKNQGKTEWTKMNTFSSTKEDVTVAFLLQNFILERKTITAESSIEARFDNFRINAAQEIIEEEI